MHTDAIFTPIEEVVKGDVGKISNTPCESLSAIAKTIQPNAFFAYFAALCFGLKVIDETNLSDDIIILQDTKKGNTVKAIVIYSSTARTVSAADVMNCKCRIDVHQCTPIIVSEKVSFSEGLYNSIYRIADQTICDIIIAMRNDTFKLNQEDVMCIEPYLRMMSFGIWHRIEFVSGTVVNCPPCVQSNYTTVRVAYIDHTKAQKMLQGTLRIMGFMTEERDKLIADINSFYTVSVEWYRNIMNETVGMMNVEARCNEQLVEKYKTLLKTRPLDPTEIVETFNAEYRAFSYLYEKCIDDMYACECDNLHGIGIYTGSINKYALNPFYGAPMLSGAYS